MGVRELVIGSFLVVGLCEVLALPLGLGAAVYMAEYASKNLITGIIRFFIETLAGAPSIVLGLFGFTYFVYGSFQWHQSWLASSICIAFLVLPWNIRVAEEAIKAVPYGFREGAYALGATKWQTINRIILLSASPGVLTGFVLGLGTALGETTILLLVSDTGHTTLDRLTLIGGIGIPTLQVQIKNTFYNIYAGGGANIGYQQTNIAFAMGFVLLMLFLAISFIALIARNYLAKKSSGL